MYVSASESRVLARIFGRSGVASLFARHYPSSRIRVRKRGF